MSKKIFIDAFFTQFHAFLGELGRVFPADEDFPAYDTALTLMQRMTTTMTKMAMMTTTALRSRFVRPVSQSVLRRRWRVRVRPESPPRRTPA
jgi:hypothetical protein